MLFQAVQKLNNIPYYRYVWQALAGRTAIIKVIRFSFIYFSFLFMYYFLSIRNTFFFEVIIDCDQQMANDIKEFKSKSVNCTNTYPITFNLVWIWSLLVVC